MKKPLFLGLFAVLSIIMLSQTTNYAFGAVIPTFLTIDLSGTPNLNDFPYGITCDDPNYAWVTITSQGKLARIDKNTQSITLFDNDPSSASGRDWYSDDYEPTSGDIFVVERDNGLVLRHDPELNSWTNIPIIPNLISLNPTKISYPLGFDNEPATIRLQETTHGLHTYDMSIGSFGELTYANGYIWVALNYSMDFDSEGNTVLADQAFNGIIRINPIDNSVTSYAISGSSELRGITIDSLDPTILWISDFSSDKVFKFSTNTNTVVQTIALPVGSKARGMTNDDANIYIAMNKPTGSGNSKILKVVKADSTISEIDTGALIGGIGDSGTFSIFRNGSTIIWTDQSGHFGTFDTGNPTLTMTATNTIGSTSSNHFGCVVGTQFWFAGHGSAKIGIISLGSGVSESSHGDSCAGDCYSPHLGNDENSKFFYDDGLIINGKPFEIKNELHNHRDKIINLPVGIPVNMTLKVQDSYPDNVNNCEIGIGIKKGQFYKQDAMFILGISRSFDNEISTYHEGDNTAFENFSGIMFNTENNVICEFIWNPTKYLDSDMFALEVKDIHRYYSTYFVNDGIVFKGLSKVGTPVYDVMDADGTIVTIITTDLTLENPEMAVDKYRRIWHFTDGFWKRDFVMPDSSCMVTKQGYDRYCPEFTVMKYGQELLAKEFFDSSIIQSYPDDPIESELIHYDRLHNSVENMLNAQVNLAIKKTSTKS